MRGESAHVTSWRHRAVVP